MLWTKRRRGRAAAAVLAAALCLACLPVAASGAEPVDTGREVSLTVEFGSGGNAVEGGVFRLYKVAEMSPEAKFTMTEEFAGYPVTISGLDSSGLKALANTLAAYSARDKIEPADTGTTGAGGAVSFPTEGKRLTPGLYLVAGDDVRAGGVLYRPQPFLLSLPCRGQEGQWVYDVTAAVKFDREEDSGDGGTTEVRALKVWRDQGNENRRPAGITVQLLRDGEIYDTAELTEETSWRHVWTGLEKGRQWQLTEGELPPGYTVLIDRQGVTFVVTNTYTPGSPDNPNNPDTPDRPGGHTPGGGRPGRNIETFEDGDVPLGGMDIPDELLEIPEGDIPLAGLPQTGMLWWPVPWLACAGLACFTLGWYRHRMEAAGLEG